MSGLRSRLRLKSFVIAGAAFASIAACSRSESTNVTISGSTTVLPVVSRAAETYADAHDDVRVIVNAGGSGVGVTQLGEGRTDIGMISRNISDSENEKYAGVNFETHVIGRDAVVPVVSSEIYDAGVTALTIGQIGDIYLGKVENWSEVGGPDKEILVIDKEASRGTRQVFMEVVLGDGEAAAPGANLVLGSNNEEQTALTQSDSAIGMLSHAWLNDDVKGLSIVLEDGSRIEPDIANIEAGRYPIARDLLLVTSDTTSDAAREFIDYILSADGQEIVEASGYVKVSQ